VSTKLVYDVFVLFTCLVLGCGPVELTNRHYIVVDTDSTVHVTYENLITLMSQVSQRLAVGTQHWRRDFVKSEDSHLSQRLSIHLFNCTASVINDQADIINHSVVCILHLMVN
jgi:hypothetical protein